MEEGRKHQIIAEAQEHWNAGHPLDTGRLLYEHIPPEYRPIWAAGVLEAVRGYIPSLPQVEAVLEFAKTPNKWGKVTRDITQDRWEKAHGVFDAVRCVTLQHRDPLSEGVLTLAENVAKVAFNAHGYPAPFDHDAGWEIAQNLKWIIDQINDAEFATNAWAVLSCDRFIELEDPVMCNPFCEVCGMNGLIPVNRNN